MQFTKVLHTAKDTITVKRVFAEPRDVGGVTIIAAASVAGGAGGGSGTDPQGQHGDGGGFGATARPVGAYLIKDGQVTWRPAVDANRVITMAALVAIAYLLRRPRTTNTITAPAARR